MKRERKMLVLFFCLLALTGGLVQVAAQESQTAAEAKRAVEAEKLKAQRAIESEKFKSKRTAETEKLKANRAIESEKLRARRAVETEKLKANRAIKREQLLAKRATEAEKTKAKRAIEIEKLRTKLAASAKQSEMLRDGTFKLLGSRFNDDGRMVKGAPYSAKAITECTQTLSDGNQIILKEVVIYVRDSEGRTRVEQTLRKVGKWVAAGDPKRIIMIVDPVAGHYYYLDPGERKATKTPLYRRVTNPAARQRVITQRQNVSWERQRKTFEEQRSKQRRLFEEQWEQRRRGLEEQWTKPQASREEWEKQKQMFEEQRTKEWRLFDDQQEKQKQRFEEQQSKEKQRFEESMSRPGAEKPMTPVRLASPEEKRMVASSEVVSGKKTERLGRQVVEGVQADGTRTTRTIPVGEIGNTQPIYVVDESWYSPDLQMRVMTRHHDPRFGDTVFRLTNINRAEPARTLFEVPADYTVVENPRSRFSTSPRPQSQPKFPTKPVEPAKATSPPRQ